MSESLLFKTANEFGLIVFVGLADKYRDPFASFHQYLFACTVSQPVAIISLPLFYNVAISITIEMAVKIKNYQLVNLSLTGYLNRGEACQQAQNPFFS